MSAKVFFDTTVLIYAFAQDNRRTAIAEELLEVGGAISVHVLNEFVAVARRKLGMSWKELIEAVTAIRGLCLPPVAITVEIHDEALRIAQRYGYHIYDSLVLAAAVQGEASGHPLGDAVWTTMCRMSDVIAGLTACSGVC